ncbi:MAG: class I SAM-dependent rRNA methyltransferase [Pseudomonadota bacterium]
MPARAEPSLLIADDWRDYRLLDSGDGEKLEQVGPYRFVRPEPQALWGKRLRDWQADAIFAPAAAEDEDAGRWRFNRQLPESWPMRWEGLEFQSRPTPFRHLAFFPEQSVHWRFAREALSQHKGPQPEVLNLFGYTGLQRVAGLENTPIRWICDDALTFVERELRRGRRYDGIILDPPKFGRGPNGETWRLETQLNALLTACATLLRQSPDDPLSARGFMVATVYAVRLSYIALAQTAADAFASPHGVWESGEMALPHADDARLLPTAIFVRWRSN